MKYFAILFFSIIAFGSCTKTKTETLTIHDTDTVTTTQYDTTKIFLQPALLGTWQDISGVILDQTFNEHTLKQGYTAPFNYVASGDSIYVLGSNKVVFTVYGYKISKTNDTLIYYNVNNSLNPSDTFKRVN